MFHLRFFLCINKAYLTSLIITKTIEHLQKIFPLIESWGYLPYVIHSSSILSLTYDEIIEVVDELNYPIINENGRFNSIFGLSRKKFNETYIVNNSNIKILAKKYTS